MRRQTRMGSGSIPCYNGALLSTMSTPPVLVLVASPKCHPGDWTLIAKLAKTGARIIAWQHPNLVQDLFPSPDVAAALREHGIASVSLEAALGEDISADIEDRIIAWLKDLSKTPLIRGENFRSLFRYQHLCLWWWAELFLYHRTPLRLLIRDVEALARLLEKERPSRLVVVAPVRELGRAASALMEHAEILPPPRSSQESRRKTYLELALAALKTLGTGVKALVRPAPTPRPKRRRRLFFLTHASMWRERPRAETNEKDLAELYFDQLLAATASSGDEMSVVAVGPPIPFKQRNLRRDLKDILEWGDRGRPYVSLRRYFTFSLGLHLARAYFECWQMWRTFRRLPDLRKALSLRGVPLGPSSLVAFRDTFLLQLPWAIRSYREVRAALENEDPDVMVLYAEYSGFGRAALAAARSLAIPSFAVQHGILYPRLFGIIHEKDEVGPTGNHVPLPTRTAVFGTLARQLLVDRGNYDPESIIITGSPKFDALVEAGKTFDRARTRKRVAVAPEAPMLVVASRFTAIGPVFTELVRASQAIEGLWVLVKPHQAEQPDPYDEIILREHASRVRVVPAKANLLELLYASDGLITVDSFASSEALVLGRPVLVVNLPSNLGALVKKQVALGVYRGEPIEPRLRQLLFDRESRKTLEQFRKKYVLEFASGADGRSTERIVRALRETADAPLPPATGVPLERVELSS